MRMHALGLSASTCCTTASAVALGHAQVEHHDVGVVPLVERDRLLAVARFGDDLHVGLLVDDRRQPVAHHRVIVREQHTDSLLHDGGHQEARFSMRTLTRVPCPGALSICHSPPMAPARWRMLRTARSPRSRSAPGSLLHADTVIGDGELPVCGLVAHGDAHAAAGARGAPRC